METSRAGLWPALHVREDTWDPPHVLRLEIAAQHQLPRRGIIEAVGDAGDQGEPAAADRERGTEVVRAQERSGDHEGRNRGSERWPSWSTTSSSQYTRSTSGSRFTTCTISKTQSGASRSPDSTIIARVAVDTGEPVVGARDDRVGHGGAELDAMIADVADHARAGHIADDQRRASASTTA